MFSFWKCFALEQPKVLNFPSLPGIKTASLYGLVIEEAKECMFHIQKQVLYTDVVCTDVKKVVNFTVMRQKSVTKIKQDVHFVLL